MVRVKTVHYVYFGFNFGFKSAILAVMRCPQMLATDQVTVMFTSIFHLVVPLKILFIRSKAYLRHLTHSLLIVVYEILLFLRWQIQP